MRFKFILLWIAAIIILTNPGSVASAATSDINNDGRDDIVSLYDYGNANTGVFVFKSTGTAFDLALPWRSGPGNWEWSRTKLATGDFDGDFDADVFALYDYGNADTGVFVFKSNGTTFDLAMPWRSGPGNWEWGRTKIVAGDFDGDNRDDIMALYDYGNANMGVFVFKSNGTTFDLVMPWRSGPGNWELSRTKLSAGDFNNDNRDDIMALYDYGNANTGVFVFKSTGTAFDLAKPWSSGPGNWEWGRTKMVAGDFDGDNLADISALYDYGNANTGMFLFKSNGVNAFTESRSYLSGPGNLEAGRCKLTSGDFAPTVGKEAAILYDYGNANMGVFVFAHAGASSTITPFWFSGPGNWQLSRTRVANSNTFIPGAWTPGRQFIDINLSAQVLTCVQEGSAEVDEGVIATTQGPIFSTLVSSGRPPFDTPAGNFAVYWKDPVVDMSGFGGTSEYYYVPNVPYVLWFYGNYSIHGAYWHNDFGNVRSHGCVNVPVDAGAWLYNWAQVGTPVFVHY